MLVINATRCINCTLCSLLCPVDAISNGQIDAALCIQCGECKNNCPEKAIIDAE